MGTLLPRRGLQNVRTQSSRKPTSSLQTPEMYIKLTSLEMERSRRVMERDRLLERVRILDERLQAIAREQEDMRNRIARQTGQPDTVACIEAKPASIGFKY